MPKPKPKAILDRKAWVDIFNKFQKWHKGYYECATYSLSTISENKLASIVNAELRKGGE